MGKERPSPTLGQLGLQADASTAGTPSGATTPDLNRWWRLFPDTKLGELIELGLAENLDLKLAAARLKPDSPFTTARINKSRIDFAAKRIALGAEIARHYVMARTRQAMVENVTESLARQDENLGILKFRVEAKLVSALDREQAEAERARVAAMLPGLRTSFAADVARLGVLTGQSPVALTQALTPLAPIPVGPDPAIIGDTAQAIARRPDIVLASAKFARSDRRRKPTAMATAALKQSTLLALENLENARASFESAKMREADLHRAFDATGRAAQLARKQYREGLADFTTLKDAERTLLSVGNELAMAKADRAIALVTLYVASGGGWDRDAIAPDRAESPGND